MGTGIPAYWLQMCSFSDVGTMTIFQKSLLWYVYHNYQAVQSGVPPDADVLWWKRWHGPFGPTLYDEVILEPYKSDKILGIFWAHDGRLLNESEPGFAEVCSATEYYAKE